MASPEAFHWQRFVFAPPDDRTGSDASGQTGAYLPQEQNPLTENPQAADVDQLASHASALLGLTAEIAPLGKQDPQQDFSLSEQLSADSAQQQLQNSRRVPSEGDSYTKQSPYVFSGDPNTVKAARRAMWQETGYIPPLAGGQDRKKLEGSLEKAGKQEAEQPKIERYPSVTGQPGIDLQRDLSLNAKKLLDCLIEERGDADLLPTYAEEDKFDLNAALDELRGLGLLDESDPRRVKLVSRRLE